MSDDTAQTSTASSLLKRSLLAMEHLQEKLDAVQRERSEPIAVVGMACRFPGGSNDPEAYWRLLRDGVDAITEIPADRWDLASVYDPDPEAPGKMHTRWGGFLDQVAGFDAPFFGLAPAEAAFVDPQQRLLLEVAWEALEAAGQAPDRLSHSRTGVFVGVMTNDYSLLQLRTGGLACINSHVAAGSELSFIAGRLAYTLGLQGPAMVLCTACSSSLVAVHLACQSLRSREADMALAGGVNVITSPEWQITSAKIGALAADGRCKSFDAAADGYVRGEGCGVLVLKRLSDAVAAGDRVLALVRGSAVNHGGPSGGLVIPSGPAQQAVIRKALADCGVQPAEVGYVETHGSGTPLGDPIELEALQAVLREGRPAGSALIVGSVKTNVGHLEAAAGVAGLSKVILSLLHGEIPPHLHFKKLNPYIAAEEGALVIPTSRTPWPPNRPRIAGVSSFGLSGINAHVVLQEAPAAAPSGASRPWQLLLLSARTSTALEAATDRLAAHLRGHPEQPFADAAYTLAAGRSQLAQRRILVARDAADAADALAGRDPARVLTGTAPAEGRPVVFMFPGLGDHYPDMALGLYRSEPRFRHEVDRCADLLAPRLGEDLREALFPGREHPAEEEDDGVRAAGPDLRRMLGRHAEPAGDAAARRLGRTEIAQPAVFVIEYALAQLLIEWGIRPAALIGYSLGEYVAACLAGVFPLEDALALVADRARLIGSLPAGAMLAVPLPEPELLPLLASRGLSLAAVNGAALCVAAGPCGAVEDLRRHLTERGVASSPLQTSHAFHSTMMTAAAAALTERVRAIAHRAPRIPLVTNVTGGWMTAEQAADPGYWARHMCEPVRFAEGVAALLDEQPERLLLEVGPGATLTSFARQSAAAEKAPPLTAFPTLRSAFDRQPDAAFLLGAAGRLWAAGAAWDPIALWAGERRARVALPTYPFERQRHWIAVPAEGTAAAGPAAPPRPGGVKTPDLGDWFYAPVWKQSPRPAPPPRAEGRWLVFLPAAGPGRRLAERLAQAGADVVAVRPGDAFARLADREYTLDPRDGGGYSRLLEALGEPPARVVHLWGAGPSEGHQRAQDLGFHSLLHLTRELTRKGGAARLDLAVVTAYAQRVTGDEPLCPERATALGACRVIPQEYLQISCRSLDVELPEPGSWREAALVELLAAELLGAPADSAVALRGGQRWVQAFQPVRLEAVRGRPQRLRQRGVYLLTGGLGGVGSELAELLARELAARLVLVGRSPLPDRDTWDGWLASHGADDPLGRRIRQVRTLEALGAEVEVVTADVADEPALRHAVEYCRSRFGGLHGVVHAAGLTRQDSLRSIPETGPSEVASHFRSKVDGTLALAAALHGLPLDFVLLCSSISTVLGGLGFAAYAAANLFLDAFAHHQTQLQRVPWISVDWDTWSLGERLRKDGVPGGNVGATLAELEMLPAEGGEAFRRILASWPAAQVVVSTGDLESRIDQWVRLASLRAEPAAAPAQAPALHRRPELQTPYAPPGSDLERAVCQLWQEVLGIDGIGIHDNFFDLGGHSLLATQVSWRLRERFQVDLPGRMLFETPTPASLARALEALTWTAAGGDQPAAGVMIEGEL